MIKEYTDEEKKPVWTDGTKIQNQSISGEYTFRHGVLTRSANYNSLCKWLTERIREKNDQYAL